MSVRVMSWVWDHSRATKTDRLVLLAIADCASDDGANAYPSISELMRKTGLSERAVQAATTRLVVLGELFVGRNDGPRGCNRYRIVMRTPADPAPPQILHPAAAAPTPADPAPPPPQRVHPTPADPAPGTVLEPSKEPSRAEDTATTLTFDLPATTTATFEAFWEIWPKKVKRKEAEKAYAKAAKGRDSQFLVDQARRWAGLWQAAGTDKQFIPDPTTWLNNERWTDEAPRPRTNGNGHKAWTSPADQSVYDEEL